MTREDTAGKLCLEAHIFTTSPSFNSVESSPTGEKWPTTLHASPMLCFNVFRVYKNIPRVSHPTRGMCCASPQLAPHLFIDTHVGKAMPFSMVFPLNTLATALQQHTLHFQHWTVNKERRPHGDSPDSPGCSMHQSMCMRTRYALVAAHSSMKLSPLAHRSMTFAPAFASFMIAARAPASGDCTVSNLLPESGQA